MSGAAGDEDSVRRALRTLWHAHRADVDDLVVAIRHGIADPSPDGRGRARRAAHRLAGSLGTFGLADGSQLARRLEEALDPSTDPSAADATDLASLVAELAAVVHRFDEDAPLDGIPSAAAARRPGRTVAVVGFTASLTAAFEAEAAARGTATVVAPDLDAVVAMADAGTIDAVVVDLDRVDLGLAGGAEWPAAAPPVVAVSGGRRLADRVAATRRGARRYVQHPATAHDIVASVESMWASRRRTATVVAVDDDQMVLDALRILLADDDVLLIAVNDQEQFWKEVHDHLPDVVVLDVDMPEISGIELCRVLRSDERWQQTGVIFLTAHRDAATVHAVFEAGADDMVVKPIIGPELRARIASRIERTDLHRRLAESDGLTGLTNRATTQRSTERMAQTARSTGRSLSVALVDLDHFKGINDVHGHHAGDEVLRRFAELARAARPALAGRWGGEEFLLVFDGVDALGAKEAVERILAVIGDERFATADGGTFGCSFSAGVAELGPADGGLDALVQRADEALYHAKATGRSRVVVADLEP